MTGPRQRALRHLAPETRAERWLEDGGGGEVDGDACEDGLGQGAQRKGAQHTCDKAKAHSTRTRELGSAEVRVWTEMPAKMDRAR